MLTDQRIQELKTKYNLNSKPTGSQIMNQKNELRGQALIDSLNQKAFKERISDDLNTPMALSLLWDLIKDPNISNKDKKATILDFDKVLGLDFESVVEDEIPSEILKLAEERQLAKTNKDYAKSDELRNKITSLGYEIKDSEDGYKINKI
jgi:cysteinyl-tRNA synthetase